MAANRPSQRRRRIHLTHSDSEPLLGNLTPRLETPSLGLPSRGQDLIDFAAAVDRPFLPWQEYLSHAALEYEPKTGRWARRTIGVTVARQNGKTRWTSLRLLAGLFIWGEDSWVSMAQNRALALDTFRQATEIIEEHSWLRREVKRLNRTNGQEELVLNSGARWAIVAATPDSPRGKSGNLFVDELREISPETWGAAAPITRKPWRQTIVASNAGDPSSTVLASLRAAALSNQNPRLGWWEWSADPKLAIDDRRGWAQANPSLGVLVDEDALAASLATDPTSVFMTEALCQPVDNALESPWPIEAWSACYDPNLTITPGKPTWLAIDVSPDRTTATLVGAQLLDDDKIGVGLLETWTSEGSLDDLAIAGTIATWARKYHARVVAFDRWTASAIAARLASAGVPVADVSRQVFYQACDELLNAMTNKRLVHAGQPELTAHVAGCARKTDPSGGWRIIKASRQQITAAVALAMTVHHAVQPQRQAGIRVVD